MRYSDKRYIFINDSNGNASSVGNESNTDTGVTGTAGALMLFGLSAWDNWRVYAQKVCQITF